MVSLEEDGRAASRGFGSSSCSRNRTCLYPFFPGRPRKPSNRGALPRSSSERTPSSVWGDGRAEEGGVQDVAESQRPGCVPGGPAPRTSSERSGHSAPHLLSGLLRSWGGADAFRAPALQTGKLRLRGKGSVVTEPQASLSPVCLPPEPVVSSLLNSLGDTPAPWLHFSAEPERTGGLPKVTQQTA